MSENEAYATLRKNLGKQIQILLGGQRVPVVVTSVDPDGALFRSTASDLHDTPSEFWVAFDHIDAIELRQIVAN